jgi:hypothetical protein
VAGCSETLREPRCPIGRSVVVLAVLVAASTAVADDDNPAPPPPAVKGTALVRTTASWRWQVVTAPKIPRAVGALAVSGVDVAAGRTKTVAPVLGDPVAGPAAWPYDVTGDLEEIGPPADGLRIAAAFGVTTFQVTGRCKIAMLELRCAIAMASRCGSTGSVSAKPPRGPSTTLARARPRMGDVLHPGRTGPVAPGRQHARGRGPSIGTAQRPVARRGSRRAARSRHRARADPGRGERTTATIVSRPIRRRRRSNGASPRRRRPGSERRRARRVDATCSRSPGCPAIRASRIACAPARRNHRATASTRCRSTAP